MIDLTKITTPFGLLDDDTKDALTAHGGPYEAFCQRGHLFCWRESGEGGISIDTHQALAWRVKPQPLTKPSIDWSHVAPECKWLARDKNGECSLFTERPSLEERIWFVNGWLKASPFASLNPGTCDWRDSLVKRPEGDA